MYLKKLKGDEMLQVISDVLHLGSYALAAGAAFYVYRTVKKASAEMSR